MQNTEKKAKIDARFLEECAEEFMKSLRSGELHTLMSQSVLSTRAERPGNNSIAGTKELTRNGRHEIPDPSDAESAGRMGPQNRSRIGGSLEYSERRVGELLQKASVVETAKGSSKFG